MNRNSADVASTDKGRSTCVATIEHMKAVALILGGNVRNTFGYTESLPPPGQSNWYKV
jgi:hypothetical protein